MNNKDLAYDKIMELIDSVKIYSGCDNVELWGNNQTFEELMASGFPLGEFKCKKVLDELDESRLYIIPTQPKSIKLYFEYDEA